MISNLAKKYSFSHGSRIIYLACPGATGLQQAIVNAAQRI